MKGTCAATLFAARCYYCRRRVSGLVLHTTCRWCWAFGVWWMSGGLGHRMVLVFEGRMVFDDGAVEGLKCLLENAGKIGAQWSFG